ncbi:MAG: helix-turn-helix domain-containing protein [Deltaproteobacteria bacterium]|nr:helix-turn-helix domain-containing protein [Deltaproteobacteria bacterium]
MSETDGKDSGTHEPVEEPRVPHDAHGPGALLREERERKGLSQRDISERTRLRPRIIESLEREMWDALPPPAFVRGFLRIYAKALSLDEKEVLALYRRIAPAEADSFRTFLGPPRHGKRNFLLFLCIAGALAALSFLWWEHVPPGKTLDAGKAVPPVRSGAGETVSQKGDVPPASLPKEPEPAEVSAATPFQASAVSPWQTAEETAFVPERQELQTSPAQEEAPFPTPEQHVLRAQVSATTWVRVHADDLAPREYMFQPGHQHEWKAREGFYLVVGNADGITLEFDGRMVPKLGAPAQVVRVKLPEDFRHDAEGN